MVVKKKMKEQILKILSAYICPLYTYNLYVVIYYKALVR